MRTFLVLLRKEVTELLNWQLIVPLVVVAALFMGLGTVMNQEQERARQPQTILIADHDKSPASAVLAETLEQANFKPSSADTALSDEALVAAAREQSAPVVLRIPEGFGAGIAEGEPQTVQAFSIIRNFSFIANQSSAVLEQVLNALNVYFGNQLISAGSSLDPADVREPIKVEQFVAVKERIAAGSPLGVLAYVGTQTTFIPIILFVVIMMAAQMIATTVSSEKENKTLETLLTLPVSRKQVVTAKMLAAGLVALLSAGVYIVGFRGYVNGMAGGDIGQVTEETRLAIETLGLSLGGFDYLYLGASLFLGILVALAIAMILGAFAEDVKSIQGLITPLMILIMIPYVVSLFLDVERLSPAIKAAYYAIPFSHTFMAAPNLMLQQTEPVLWGIAYLALAFVIFLSIAAWIFSSDRIVTLKITFTKKKQASA